MARPERIALKRAKEVLERRPKQNYRKGLQVRTAEIQNIINGKKQCILSTCKQNLL
jgi:hypothetical protein